MDSRLAVDLFHSFAKCLAYKTATATIQVSDVTWHILRNSQHTISCLSRTWKDFAACSELAPLFLSGWYLRAAFLYALLISSAVADG